MVKCHLMAVLLLTLVTLATHWSVQCQGLVTQGIGHQLYQLVRVSYYLGLFLFHTLVWTLDSVIDCGLLADPTNGQVDTSSGTTFGSAATYCCNTLSRNCGADGLWTSTEPNCHQGDRHFCLLACTVYNYDSYLQALQPPLKPVPLLGS